MTGLGLEVFIAPELQRSLDPDAWWRAIERNVPRALTPVAAAMKAAAPKGKSGKLSRNFEVISRRVSQGFIQGVEADIVTKVPYGHLVERGHKIIARGPGRRVLRDLEKIGGPWATARLREKRAAFRRSLKERQAAGAIGFVQGRFFGQRTLEDRREQVLSLLGSLVMQDVARAV